MPLKLARFTKGLLALGVLLLLLVGAYFALRGLRKYPLDPMWYVAGADAERGRAALLRYGCVSCHTIPGIRLAKGRVGPRLENLREQVYLAGVLPNGPDHLVAWIRHPQTFSPRTAMPDLDVTEADARDMAAYLYEHSRP